MPLVRSGHIVEDRFVRVLDEEAVPETGAVIVPAARFLADHVEFARREAPTGVLWSNAKPIAELVPHLDRLALVALVFPTFKDGRAYSQARLLRERHAYRGELRATGDILRDQFLYLMRSGFDTFEVKKPADAEAFAQVVARYSVFYQPTGDGRLSARRQRLPEPTSGRPQDVREFAQ